MIKKQAIRQKKGHCPDCPSNSSERVLINGRCSSHYWQHRSRKNAAKHRETRVERAGLSVPQEKHNSKTLSIWFQYHMDHCDRCEETGDLINKFDRDELFCSQAHILPKEHFDSVKGVLANHMTLSARNGSHKRFDLSWHSAQRMKVWPIAVARFKTFCHLIAQNEVRKLPDSLREIYEDVMASKMV